jgi:phenylacetate-CoA ligase
MEAREPVTPSAGQAAAGAWAEQRERLATLLEAVGSVNAFQRRRLAGASIDAPEDLRRIPAVTKADLAADQDAHPPFGSNLTFPLRSYTHVHQTTGTTGAPLRVLRTPDDWSWWRRGFALSLRRSGVDAEDRVALAFSFGPYVQFWAAYEGTQEIGALVLPLGGMDSVQRLETIAEYEATTLICTPTYALHLAAVAHQRQLDAALESVQRVLCMGEPGGSLVSTRGRIEELWNARCCDHAGLTEVGPFGVPCAEHGGLHLDEEEFICEVLGAEGEPVAAGEQGELVLTALAVTGYPAIRYRTGDVVTCDAQPCPSGHPGRWVPAGIAGRVDDMVVIRGMNVFPSAIEQTLREIDGGVGEFRITFYTDPGAMDEVKLEAELSDTVSARRIQERMRRQLGLRVRVVPLRPGVLPRTAHKASRVVDARAVRGSRHQLSPRRA